jgi:hypothetical protein
MIDFIADLNPQWKVDHYSGEFGDEDEFIEQVKTNRPTVLVDIETISMDEVKSSSDKRAIHDDIEITIYCAVGRKKRDFKVQQIEAYSLAVLVRNALIGERAIAVADSSGNKAHSDGVIMPGTITKTMSNQHLSVYELLAVVPILTDLDYAIE